MSTTNTDYTWYWYIREKEGRGYLGIIDENGDAPDTAGYTIQVWATEMQDELTDTTDTLPIPQECELGFIKGIAFEYLQMHGINKPDYSDEYKAAIDYASARTFQESKQPMILKPFDMRQD